jgi:hypothetical protein
MPAATWRVIMTCAMDVIRRNAPFHLLQCNPPRPVGEAAGRFAEYNARKLEIMSLLKAGT